MFNNFDLYSFLLSMAALLICLDIHEFAHAYSAYRAGDETAKLMGRVSLNPFDHLEPIGTIMMVLSSIAGFGIGWGKPVPVNPYNLRRPRWDNLMVSLWGPLSNLLTALVTGTLLRFWGNSMSDPLYAFIAMITLISIGLAVFNLIPIPPLDGSHIFSALLPYELARRYDRIVGQYGAIVFILLLLPRSSVLLNILGPPRQFLWHLFTGLP